MVNIKRKMLIYDFSKLKKNLSNEKKLTVRKLLVRIRYTIPIEKK